MSSLPQTSKWTSSQLMTNLSYEVNHYSDKDFKSVNLHSHDFYELYFFIGGDASYLIENGHYRLQCGDILLISPQTLHQLDINDSKATYERIVLWINPKYLRSLSSQITDLTYCFQICADRKDYLIRDLSLSRNIKTMLHSLYFMQNEDAFGNDIECENIIRSILLSLCKYQQKTKSDRASERLYKHTNQTVTDIINYIDLHIAENLSLDVIAEKFYLSKFYISHLFKKDTNSTLHQYILKKRLTLSKRFIESDIAISEVCAKCGFQDYSHFFRAFKAEFGITPKQYLSLIRRNIQTF